MDIGGGEEVRKYPHMCSSSLGAKGGRSSNKEWGGGGEGKRVSWGVTLRPQFNTDPASQNILVWTFGAPMLL